MRVKYVHGEPWDGISRMPCGCTYRDVEPRVVPGFPGEATSIEVVEACRVHEDWARRAAFAAPASEEKK